MKQKNDKSLCRPVLTVAAPCDLQDQPITKKATGIKGFDDITFGGIPEHRLTAVIGNAGAGKTVFALQTLVNRLKTYGEPGIFISFEEPIPHIRRNMASFDWNFFDFGETGLNFIDARVPPDAVLTGAFDLAGLLAGLSEMVKETGIQNIVFDGIDMLLSGLKDERLVRQELARLDDWIRRSELTAMITVKALGIGDHDQLRADFLQYITDCVVILDGSFTETTSSRSLRIAKYRGSGFTANPVPVVISRSGLEVVAFKGTRLNYPTFTQRVSSGVPRFDSLLNGGYIRGSSILISGAPGTSKTSLSANFAAAACERGEKALFVSFDESAAQIIANMKSIGLNLKPYIDAGKLTMLSLLSSSCSPEEHLVTISGFLERLSPDCLVIDPLSSLLKANYAFSNMICESLLDNAKSRGITLLCTSLLDPITSEVELSASRISTIADTWIHVSYVANEGERSRALTIIKSRGTGHSNQVRELMLNQSGVDLVDVYVAEGEVLMGSARIQKEAEARRQQVADEIAFKRIQMDLARELAQLKAGVLAATEELERKQQEAAFLSLSEENRVERDRVLAAARLNLRRADKDAGARPVPRDRKRKAL